VVEKDRTLRKAHVGVNSMPVFVGPLVQIGPLGGESRNRQAVVEAFETNFAPVDMVKNASNFLIFQLEKAFHHT
jgi:hypothetical protein